MVFYGSLCRSIQPFGHKRHGPKIGRVAVPPFWGERAESPSNTMSFGLRPTSLTMWHLDPSSHLATTDIGRKLGAVPLWG